MNIIHSLPCGCHRGLRECDTALGLSAARKAAYDQIERASLYSSEWWKAYALWTQCHNTYIAHFEQGRERIEVLV